MAKASAQGVPQSFEAALKELETIVASMESGEATLENSLAAYERGMVLMKYCEASLTAAEQKIRMLENGALKDFDPAREGGPEA